MMARSTKKTSKATSRKQASKKKKGVFQRMLTAEGWKRLMMGGRSRKSAKKR